MWFQKSWYHTLTWIFSGELFGYFHNLQLLFWNFSRRISMDTNLLYIWKTVLIPQYLLTRIFTIIFSNGFFHFFSLSLMVFSTEMGYQYMSSLTQWTIVSNSKIGNCDCFVFVNHTRIVFFSSIGMCCLYLLY